MEHHVLNRPLIGSANRRKPSVTPMKFTNGVITLEESPQAVKKSPFIVIADTPSAKHSTVEQPGRQVFKQLAAEALVRRKSLSASAVKRKEQEQEVEEKSEERIDDKVNVGDRKKFFEAVAKSPMTVGQKRLSKTLEEKMLENGGKAIEGAPTPLHAMVGVPSPNKEVEHVGKVGPKVDKVEATVTKEAPKVGSVPETSGSIKEQPEVISPIRRSPSKRAQSPSPIKQESTPPKPPSPKRIPPVTFPLPKPQFSTPPSTTTSSIPRPPLSPPRTVPRPKSPTKLPESWIVRGDFQPATVRIHTVLTERSRRGVAVWLIIFWFFWVTLFIIKLIS